MKDLASWSSISQLIPRTFCECVLTSVLTLPTSVKSALGSCSKRNEGWLSLCRGGTLVSRCTCLGPVAFVEMTGIQDWPWRTVCFLKSAASGWWMRWNTQLQSKWISLGLIIKIIYRLLQNIIVQMYLQYNPIIILNMQWISNKTCTSIWSTQY